MDKLARLRRGATKWKHHIIAGILIAAWCLPFVTSGNKILLGDFSFFAQAYEAIRISILDYHQFPWWNPWMSGGVPLYANPQIGVFSLQTLLVLAFGTIVGLKLAMIIYTVAGYASMYVLLTRYFKASTYLAAALSIIWIFSSFFVTHLPSHFSFAWYMLGPFFIYLALTIKTWKEGAVFGGLFALMALSQVHNAFVHITIVCGAILLARLIFDAKSRRPLLLTLGVAGGIFLLLAGHRFMLTFQNFNDFPRNLIDHVPPNGALGPLLPFSIAHNINYPTASLVPGGLHETTATIGIAGALAWFMSVFAFFYYRQKKKLDNLPKQTFITLGACIGTFVIGLGSFAAWAPYSILKLLPVFSGMRISSRWFLWMNVAMIISIALILRQLPRQSKMRLAITGLVGIAVIELFVLNVGYQHKHFTHSPTLATQSVRNYPFAQTSYLGDKCTLLNSARLPEAACTNDAYREFEATTFNLGTLYANDAFVQLALDPRYKMNHPTCPFKNDCGFVLTHNAKLTSWSPNRIVLERTGPGVIKLNMNNSSYFIINNNREPHLRSAEPFSDFLITTPDATKDIIIEIRPSLRP